MKKNLLNQRVKKITVDELRRMLDGLDGDLEVVLGFYRKKDGVYFGYLADVYGHMKYDSVIKAESLVVELVCYEDKYCTYLEDKDE